MVDVVHGSWMADAALLNKELDAAFSVIAKLRHEVAALTASLDSHKRLCEAQRTAIASGQNYIQCLEEHNALLKRNVEILEEMLGGEE